MSNPDLELKHTHLKERLRATYWSLSRNIDNQELCVILREDARLFEQELSSFESAMLKDNLNPNIVGSDAFIDRIVFASLPESKL